MNYLDVYKKRVSHNGTSVKDAYNKSTDRLLNAKFKDDNSYKLCKYRDINDCDVDSEKEVRIANNTNKIYVKYVKLRPHDTLNIGDLLYFDDNWWVIKEFEYNLPMPKGTSYKCIQTLNYKGLLEPIPCWCDNSSYGVKGEIETTYMASVDGKIQFYVQNNKYTKCIQNGWRFIFDNDENQVYKVVDSNTVTTGGVRRIVMDKTVSCAKDDFKNNIAYMEWLDDNPNTDNSNSTDKINDCYIKSNIGDMTITKYCETEFVIMNPDDTFSSGWNISVDYNGVNPQCLLITEQDDKHIKIKNLNKIKGSIFIIATKDDANIKQEVKLVK